MAMQGFVTLDGIDPRNMQPCVYRIPLPRIRAIQKHHPGAKFLDLYCVKTIIAGFYAGFEGLRTVDDAFGDPTHFVQEPDPHGVCVCGIATQRQTLQGLRPPPAGYTFVVFCDARLEIFNWAWICSDPKEENLPIHYASRFDRTL